MQVPKGLAQSVEQTKVEYRRLGQSGLRVSNPILGCMAFGDPNFYDWCLNEEEAVPILKYAYDHGVNTWDTANGYSNGESERIIGVALKKFDIPRHKVVIMTKIWSNVGEEPAVRWPWMAGEIGRSKDYVNNYGLSRQAIFRQVDASLERLGTDYIDLLQIHRYDESAPMDETLKALHDLVQLGKVRYLGSSSMRAVQFAQLQFCAERNGWTKFVSMQNHYNLLYREEEREMIQFCNDTGVGLIPYSPLCRGHLARPPSEFGRSLRSADEKAGWKGSHGTVEPDLSIIGRVHETAEKHGWPMSHVALAWINKRVAAPIVGGSSIARLEEVLGARGKVLTAEEEGYLEELYEPKPVSGH
ncbi:Aldo/keto reductase [Thozetella sp. PMI_491]|nr:Aldo/keto reductase [Thozetella sp. PMI_491]